MYCLTLDFWGQDAWRGDWGTLRQDTGVSGFSFRVIYHSNKNPFWDSFTLDQIHNTTSFAGEYTSRKAGIWYPKLLTLYYVPLCRLMMEKRRWERMTREEDGLREPLLAWLKSREKWQDRYSASSLCLPGRGEANAKVGMILNAMPWSWTWKQLWSRLRFPPASIQTINHSLLIISEVFQSSCVSFQTCQRNKTPRTC